MKIISRFIYVSALFCAAAVILKPAFASGDKPKLIVFFSPSCHSCQAVKNGVMPAIIAEFGDRIAVDYRDISDVGHYKEMIALRDHYKIEGSPRLPFIFFQGEIVSGEEEAHARLKDVVRAGITAPALQHPSGGGVNLLERFKLITPLAVAGAGLADGINPCAFTVIVFFISFLAVQGYRRRDLAVIGMSFITAVFLTYFLLGLGIFNFLYRMKNFILITRSLNLAIGIFSLCLGALSVCDVVRYIRTKAADTMALQLPQTVKNRIHAVIGHFYRIGRQTSTATENSRPHLGYLIASAFVTGFLISLLEAVCTGQLYLPTIVFVMKSSQYKFQAFRRLLVYNIMFVAPLIAVFLLALLGATSQQFSAWLKRRLVPTKIILAVVFFGLGIFLIWRA